MLCKICKREAPALDDKGRCLKCTGVELPDAKEEYVVHIHHGWYYSSTGCKHRVFMPARKGKRHATRFTYRAAANKKAIEYGGTVEEIT